MYIISLFSYLHVKKHSCTVLGLYIVFLNSSKELKFTGHWEKLIYRDSII